MNEIGEDAPATPSRKETNETSDESIGRRRHRWPVIPVGRKGDGLIGIARDGEETAERRGCGIDLLPLVDECLEALDVVTNGLAAPRNELIRILAQPLDRALAGIAGRLRISIECLDLPAQFVDRAAESLGILLREFRPLGRYQATKQSERQAERANYSEQAFSPPTVTPTERAARVYAVAASRVPRQMH